MGAKLKSSKVLDIIYFILNYGASSLPQNLSAPDIKFLLFNGYIIIYIYRRNVYVCLLFKIFIFFIYVKYFEIMELSNVKSPKYNCHIHSFLTSIHYVNCKTQTLGIIMISYYFVFE